MTYKHLLVRQQFTWAGLAIHRLPSAGQKIQGRGSRVRERTAYLCVRAVVSVQQSNMPPAEETKRRCT